MRRHGVVVASAIFALSLFVQGNVAHAGSLDIEWCAEDPVVVVFGSQFKVVSAVHAQPGAVSSFAYTLEVPSNAVGRTNVSYPNGKFGATTVVVSYTGSPWTGSGPFVVNGTVTVTAPSGSAVIVGISGPKVPTSSFAGTANTAVAFSTTVTANGAASDQSGSSAQ